MHSLNASSVYCVLYQHSLAQLNSQLFPSVFSVDDSRRWRRWQQSASLNFVAVKENDLLLGCSYSLKKGNSCKPLYWDCSGFWRRCKDLDREEDFSLEVELLEFMKNSKNPEAFPTKRELVAARRIDLVDAIIKKGGWLRLGWNWDEDAEERLREMGVKSEGNEIQGSGAAASSCNSSANCSQEALSSDTSIEQKVEESGIEGMLNRLEEERNNNLGIGFRNDKDEWAYRTTADTAECEISSRSLTGSNGLRNSLKPETWRSWIVQAESSDTDFEGVSDVSGKDALEVTMLTDKHTNRDKELGSFDRKVNQSEMERYIQEMDLKLSSALYSLRSMAAWFAIFAGKQSSYYDIRNLSHTWESLQNEIMNTQERLHSQLAISAVLGRKMAREIIDEQNKKRIESEFRDICIEWPIKASEVLLTGSFDGWYSKRKMEKSDFCTFSLLLKLYPGRYEIKFIVDGEWRIDPLRPIVRNEGNENNLLIVK